MESNNKENEGPAPWDEDLKNISADSLEQEAVARTHIGPRDVVTDKDIGQLDSEKVHQPIVETEDLIGDPVLVTKEKDERGAETPEERTTKQETPEEKNIDTETSEKEDILEEKAVENLEVKETLDEKAITTPEGKEVDTSVEKEIDIFEKKDIETSEAIKAKEETSEGEKEAVELPEEEEPVTDISAKRDSVEEKLIEDLNEDRQDFESETADADHEPVATNAILEAYQTFRTAASNSLLADCKDKSINMEFTKNYSDDLLMGQNDSLIHQGEIPPTNADLADFELPPYSGSSSGSEPRHHSPEKRKLSSSSMAARASGSPNQINVAPPDLAAVKNLILSSYSRVAPIFHWQRPIETGLFFSIGATLITALTFFSIISVVAYTALIVIIASGSIRLYKTVMKALNRSVETPLDQVWIKVTALDITLSTEKMHELVNTSLDSLNGSLFYLKQVLLVEDKVASLKFGVFLYLLTYIGAMFNGMTLISICYFALFSVPIFYEKNKTKIDGYLQLASGQISSALSVVTGKVSSLAFGQQLEASTGTTKKRN